MTDYRIVCGWAWARGECVALYVSAVSEGLVALTGRSVTPEAAQKGVILRRAKCRYGPDVLVRFEMTDWARY